MALRNWCWLAALAALGVAPGAASANEVKTLKPALRKTTHDTEGCLKDKNGRCSPLPRIAGRLIDHTRNHGEDRRIWARSLYQKRDLYVYLPPNYDPNQQYPFMIFLHGFGFDEHMFLEVIPYLDEAIVKGKLPPIIIAAPDGSLNGECSIERPGSFFINSGAGQFEDFILQDVWDHVTRRYPIRCEREAHVLAGVSMGGFGAFNLGIRHRNAFGVVMGIFPPLNLRWCDVRDGNPHADFDPRYWGWRHGFDNPHEILARVGLATVRLGQLVHPAFGEGEEALVNIRHNNPIDLIDRTRLRNGELEMFVAYGGKDEFNIDAQVESFLYLAKHRGLGVHVVYDPLGHHDAITAQKLLPNLLDWLAPRLAPYSPCIELIGR